MEDTVVRMRLFVLGLIGACTLFVWFSPVQSQVEQGSHLQVHFLDVGQGDAALIQTPSGVQVLVDGGRDGKVLHELSSVMGFGDKSIDMVVGTHPDSDHIGGLVDVFTTYTVGAILMTENKGESDVAQLYADLAANEGGEIIYARRGQELLLDASTTLRVLFPETNPEAMESNASSIVFQLEYGDTVFMFTGDSPKNIEEYLVLAEGENLKSDVLKVGHHGSRTSTSELFLDEVQPSIAVISAGAGNTYGHPHVEVTDLLFNTRVEILETAEEGTLTLMSDGTSVWRK